MSIVLENKKERYYTMNIEEKFELELQNNKDSNCLIFFIRLLKIKTYKFRAGVENVHNKKFLRNFLY